MGTGWAEPRTKPQQHSSQTITAQEGHRGTEQTDDKYEASKPRLDCSLKEAKLGHCFRIGDREFHVPGAMFLIDLGSERPIEKLPVAPLVLYW